MNTNVIEKPAIKSLPLTQEVLIRRDISGPRYTSYPTADRFVQAFDGQDLAAALELRKASGSMAALGLSLYIHIPFCESLCYYCACNKVITKQKDRAAQYLEYLAIEVALFAGILAPSDKKVMQLHLGGGSPTFFNDEQLAQLMAVVRQHFELMPQAECAIEVDPRTVSSQRLSRLKILGFNRLSFGVQDFNDKVQKAVHRIQPFEQVEQLMMSARQLGYASINLDLIYGLPQQTVQSMAATLAQVVSIQPDRIALYGYAHLPERFKPQRRIDAQLLPNAAEKTAMLRLAVCTLEKAGYIYIGMDHFALPSDSLSVAKKQGRLHRNFQGYSTLPDCDLVGLGVSSISKVGATYSQNVKTLDEYYDHLNRKKLPIERGLALSRDDLIRRAVIMSIMCQGEVNFESMELSYLFNFHDYFASELTQLQWLEQDGLVEIRPDGLWITDAGWYVVRAVAMVFDRYLQADRNRQRYSRII